MSDDTSRSRAMLVDPNLDLTQTIRRLQLPNDMFGKSQEQSHASHKALLICRDSEITKWGRRWLEREGADVAISDDPVVWQSLVKSVRPDVIVAESGLNGPGGRPLIKDLSEAPDFNTPVIALTANARELKSALECRVFDIVRRPYEWQLLGRRAKTASSLNGLEGKLSKARESATAALDVAERARMQLRSHQSFEPLTGLPNKKKFIDLLKRGMQAADRDGNVMAVFVVGFNRFRLVVEALGQESADLVLTEIGKKISECLQEVGSLQTSTKGLRTSAAANIDQARFAIMLTCSGDQDELTSLQQELVAISSIDFDRCPLDREAGLGFGRVDRAIL